MSINQLSFQLAHVTLPGMKRGLYFIALFVTFFAAFTAIGMIGVSFALALIASAAYLMASTLSRIPVYMLPSLASLLALWFWVGRPLVKGD